MHQSSIASIHRKKVSSQRSGWIRISPRRTASTAGARARPIRTNHWVESIGSITASERSERPTLWTIGSTDHGGPSRSAWVTAARARARSRPRNTTRGTAPAVEAGPGSKIVGGSLELGVPAGDLEIDRVVRRGHLERAVAEGGVDRGVA